jgi:hypothetical protein
VYDRLEPIRQNQFVQVLFNTIVLEPKGVVGFVLNPRFDTGDVNAGGGRASIELLGEVLAGRR